MRPEWYPGIIVAALVTGIFYALHSDLSVKPEPQHVQRQGANANQSNRGRLEGDNPQQISPPTPPPQQLVNPSARGDNGTNQQSNSDIGPLGIPSAWWNVILTAALVVVGGIQSRLLYHTFRANRINARATVRASRIAERAARITKRTVETMEKTAERQLRAYVFVSQATAIDPDSLDPRMDIRIRNFGQTPAHDVLVSGIVRGFNPRDARLFPDAPKDSGLSRFVFGPGQDASKSFDLKTLLNPNTMESLRSRDQHILYAWGEITYRDVFGEMRYTKYRLSIGGPEGWPDTNLMIVCPEGNEAT